MRHTMDVRAAQRPFSTPYLLTDGRCHCSLLFAFLLCISIFAAASIARTH